MMDWLTEFFAWLASLFSSTSQTPLLISYSPTPYGNVVPDQKPTFPPTQLKTSEAGIAALKEREGFKAKAYPDGNKWAIGYGHQLVSGDGLSPSSVLTEVQADQLLRRDILSREAAIWGVVFNGLTQNMFDALVSFVYNIGNARFQTSNIVPLLNNSQYVDAANFIRSNYTSGNGVPGVLTSRRASEAAQFSS